MVNHMAYAAKYTKILSGYMGQIVEWPEVITEGGTIEECRAMLRDALNEMVIAHQQLGREIPTGNALIEQLSAMITVSANASVGCGVYPRPEREGVKPSPTMAETMIMAQLSVEVAHVCQAS